MRALALAVLLLLGACAAQGPTPAAGHGDRGLARDISCVPFARALSGISLTGDAHAWWQAAEGRYSRGQAPRPGAILVFRRTRRLPQGHLAVVVRQVGPREVLVTHANWGSGSERGRVAENQRVVDVSRGNDWSAVRVWHPATGTLGVTVFPTYGFILPAREAEPGSLAAGVPAAAAASAGTL